MTYIQQGETWATTRSKINQVIKVSYTDLLADTELTYTGGASGTVTAGDLYPTTEGNWFEVAPSDAVDQHITTAGGVKLYEAGPQFSTRARAVAAWARKVARSEAPPVGTVWTFDGVSIEYDGSTTAVTDFSGWKWSGKMTLEHFGAAGDGSDDDAAWSAAMAASSASSETIHLRSGRTYGTSGLAMHTNLSIVGDPTDPPVIFLLNGSDDHVLSGTSVTDITLRDIIVDGNQANQTKGSANNARGIYFLDACHRIECTNVFVKNAVDHGLFLSNGSSEANECGKDSTFINCRAENCGSSAHTSGGGAGGTGFVGGHDSSKWFSCHATGNYLNGFKSGGRFFGCISYGNTGGGYETGFTSSSLKHGSFIGCEARGNGGDGWRNLGEIDDLIFIGCVAEENDNCGMLFGQDLDRVTVQGCTFRNNGQDTGATVSGIVGRSGIQIGGTSVSPTDITISGCQFYDDQGSPTQTNHIRVDSYGDRIHIADDNVFGACADQDLYFDGTQDTESYVGRCRGLVTTIDDSAVETLTGTATATIMKTVTIPARYLPALQKVKFSAYGQASGTAGTKIIRYQVNSGGSAISQILVSQSAGEQQKFIISGEISRDAATDTIAEYRAVEIGGSAAFGANSASLSLADPLIIAIQGDLGDAADTLTIERWQVSTS